MSMKILAVLAATLTIPALAQAQDRPAPQTTGVNWNVFEPAVDLAAVAAQPGGGSGGGLALPIFLKGGLWTSEGTGFFIGAGVDLNLLEGNRHDVRVSGHFLRVEESNGFMAEANYFYNFPLRNESFTPFLGAGLNVVHFGCDVDVPEELEDLIGDIDCGGTEAALQIGGGIKIPVGEKELILEVLIPFYDYSPFLIEVIWFLF